MVKKSFNICIISPQGYVHSMAFLGIADLLTYSLRELGFEAETSFNHIDSSKVNIIIGIHLLDSGYIKQIPAASIILNTEQLGATPANWNNNIVDWFQSGFEYWDYSDTNIHYLKQFGVKKIKKMNFGYQKELQVVPKAQERDIDVLFYGCINDRRRLIINKLAENKDLKVTTLFGVFGKDLDSWISRSKVVLNIHFYETQIFEVVRVFYLLTNSIAVACEVNNTTVIDQRFKEGIVGVPYHKLVESVVDLVRDENKLKKQREIAFESIVKYPQTEFTKSLILD